MDDETIDEMIISLSNYKTFFGIATRSLSQIRDLVRERNLRRKSRKIMTRADVDFECLKNAEIQRSAMITAVFSAMTIESYINEYAIENFSRSFFDKYLDKLDVKSKWVVYPKLVTGKEIDRESQAFESLGKLMALRNRLVHDKTRRKRICELVESDWVTEQEAEDAVNTVRNLVNELVKLDSSVDMDWLDKVEFDPFA